MLEARRRLLLQVPQQRPRVHSLSPRGWLIPTSPREVRWARCCLCAWKKTSSAWLSTFLGHLNTVQCLSPSLKLLLPVSHPAVISDPSTNASQTWHLQAPAAQTGALEPGCPPATGFAWSFYHCVLNPILTFETFLLPWTVHLSQLCVSTFIDFFQRGLFLKQETDFFLSFSPLQFEKLHYNAGCKCLEVKEKAPWLSSHSANRLGSGESFPVFLWKAKTEIKNE